MAFLNLQISVRHVMLIFGTFMQGFNKSVIDFFSKDE